eukprot:364597-Chlamydomonas_euryale.AAC.2
MALAPTGAGGLAPDLQVSVGCGCSGRNMRHGHAWASLIVACMRTCMPPSRPYAWKCMSSPDA